MQLEFSDETQESDKSLSDLSDEDGTLPYHCPPECSKGVLCCSAGEEIPLLSQLSVCEKDLGGRENFKPLELTLWNLENPYNSDKLLQKVHLFKSFRMVKVVRLYNRFFLACGLQNGQ